MAVATPPTAEKKDRLLVVDDEIEIRELIMEVGSSLGFDVAQAAEIGDFKRIHQTFHPTVISLDLQMPGADGIEYLRYLSEIDSRATILLISGFDNRVLESAKRLAVDRGLTLSEALRKPVGVNELRTQLRSLMSAPDTISKADIEAGINNAEFVLQYQPKVSLLGAGRGPRSRADRSGASAEGVSLRIGQKDWPLDSLEALVRWRPAAGKLMAPSQFLSWVERTDLIKPLTLYVVRLAFMQLEAWSQHGFRSAVALNLSGHLFADLDLPDELSELAREFGIAPAQVIFEITETAAMTNVASCLDVTARLRLKGFSLSIDDFGTGYSSMVQLYRMPFSELKVDKSFVADLGQSEEARTITDLAHNLSMSVCAEGIEDEETLELVQSLGCDRGQGYHFSRPLTADALLNMFVPSKS